MTHTEDGIEMYRTERIIRLETINRELLEALELVGSPSNEEEANYNSAQLRGLLALFRTTARAAIAKAEGS